MDQDTKKLTGPVLTEEAFFTECLDCAQPGLEGIPAMAAAGDYAVCRKIFGTYIRGTLKPEIFFTTLGKKSKKMSDDALIKAAERACRNILTSVGTPFDFGDGPIDWYSNPTFNKYPEWTWQLSRHPDALNLAKAYRLTGEERYAAKAVELMESWIAQAVVQDRPNDSLCWRTIECGIRMSQVWPEILHSIYTSPACTDEFLTLWYRSVYEHGEILSRFPTVGNWLIMEMSGLWHIGALDHCFKRAKEWFDFARKKMIEELYIQVYPDGFQNELSAGYQQTLIHHYARNMRLLTAYGYEVPADFAEGLRIMLHLFVKVMQPNKCLPNLNDGSGMHIVEYVKSFLDLLPGDQLLSWAAGIEGFAEPEEKSLILPYAGQAYFRTGWSEDDTWLCFDGGPFGKNHQHEDKLHVMFHAERELVLADTNNYAYDASEMRRYVLSTRGHNTILVDGLGQNRKKGYHWEHEMLHTKSGMVTKLTDTVDFARAVYDEGYGPEQDKTVTHERSVYFVKKLTGCKPFAVIVDRLTASEGEHHYEVQWHLDAKAFSANGLQVQGDSLRLIVDETDKKEVGMQVEYAIQHPQWNGWISNSAGQLTFRPLYCVKHVLCGKDVRWVTVLYPCGKESAPIASITASKDVADTAIVLNMADGNRITLNEQDFQ